VVTRAGEAFAVAGTFDGEDTVAAEGFTAAGVEEGRADAPAILAGSGAGDGAADGGGGQGGAMFDHVRSASRISQIAGFGTGRRAGRSDPGRAASRSPITGIKVKQSQINAWARTAIADENGIVAATVIGSGARTRWIRNGYIVTAYTVILCLVRDDDPVGAQIVRLGSGEQDGNEQQRCSNEYNFLEWLHFFPRNE